jgi:hypothetical protein
LRSTCQDDEIAEITEAAPQIIDDVTSRGPPTVGLGFTDGRRVGLSEDIGRVGQPIAQPPEWVGGQPSLELPGERRPVDEARMGAQIDRFRCGWKGEGGEDARIQIEPSMCDLLTGIGHVAW